MAKKKPGNGPVGSVVQTPDGPATVVNVAEPAATETVAPVIPAGEPIGTPVVEPAAAPVVETPAAAPVVETPAAAPVVETPAAPVVETPAAPAAGGEVISFPGGTASPGTASEDAPKKKGRGFSSWKFLSAAILAQHMEVKKLSARMIAEALGTTLPPIYSWKNGHTCPALAQEINLAKFLGIPVPEEVLEQAKKRPAAKKSDTDKAEQERQEKLRIREEQAHNKALELLTTFMATPQAQADPEAGARFFTSMKKSLLA